MTTEANSFNFLYDPDSIEPEHEAICATTGKVCPARALKVTEALGKENTKALNFAAAKTSVQLGAHATRAIYGNCSGPEQGVYCPIPIGGTLQLFVNKVRSTLRLRMSNG